MRIMIIGDLGGQLVNASKIANDRGARVFHASDIKSSFRALRSGKGADLILVDIDQDIRKLVHDLIQEHFCIPIIACGIDSNKEKAVAAIEAGAMEYLPLPPEEELIAAILETVSGEEYNFNVVYKSPKFDNIIQMAKQISPTEATILITGSSGTGKEIIAKFIHANSKRKEKDMIAINCAAIPENLLESELFGHEKGAFTGAIDRRVGKFEEADGTTLLLDEISEMDIKLQSKLLRTIQEREIVRVGGNKPISLDIRIIATSNRNLLDEIKKGNFREDLFYRLNVINLHLPDLKDRLEDVLPLTHYFIKKYAEFNAVCVTQISEEAQKILQNYTWPGNVRELENTIHRAVLLANNDTIKVKDIVLTVKRYTDTINDNLKIEVGNSLDIMEKKFISCTLGRYSNDYDKAAKVLGISIRVLNNKLKKYKLTA